MAERETHRGTCAVCLTEGVEVETCESGNDLCVDTAACFVLFNLMRQEREELGHAHRHPTADH